MKPIDSYGVKSNISFVVIKKHPTVIDWSIKIFSIEENPKTTPIIPSISGIDSSNIPSSISLSFSNKLDFIFPTDETSSNGTPMIKRQKTSHDPPAKPNGRVWTEFTDIKQVLAGKRSLELFLGFGFCFRSSSEFSTRYVESQTTRKTCAGIRWSNRMSSTTNHPTLC